MHDGTDPSQCSSLTDATTQTCLNEHILLRTADDQAMSGTERYGPDFLTNYTDSMEDGYYEPCPEHTLITVPGVSVISTLTSTYLLMAHCLIVSFSSCFSKGDLG